MKYSKLLPTIFITTLLPIAAIAAEDEKIWNNVLKPEYFAGQAIEESDNIIELEAPVRAEDPALVPIKVTSKVKQTKEHYIKKILVLVDNNPFPFVGEFEFTPESGKADIAMRIRVNSNSNIRAIAQINDGKLMMTKKFVKASGGCSAPIGANLDEAMSRLGKIKFRLENEVKAGEPNLVQLMISHPNITGMQMDQVTRFVKKSHFVKDVKVTFNGKPVLTAKTDIAISADPNFRFYFVPEKAGDLKAEVTDTSCELPTKRDVCAKGNTYTETFKVQP
ncbi:quinoprotein dehydrogenase-associated SoxYZ-like carrier [Methylobacter sp.]|uniref:quinoprotein dehydrogenase-associated SoxYZ-like carrier n=1 Tax=Methylobacter sp. TaxID=2051955 RepID=UPI0012093DA0|nr:quinoprotein dehydrogenase-associated SoxYZ-like carrier [Methylobacter sp.]TAK62188.1 MAG: quinoprotein dehydrogenase-associated SoxYZ-like carrier [Methylobacter sp.]